jgi:hypothetical protein
MGCKGLCCKGKRIPDGVAMDESKIKRWEEVAGKEVAREEWSLGSVLVLYAGQGRQQSVNLEA